VRRARRSVCSIALLLVCLEWKPNSYDYRTQLPSFPKLQHCHNITVSGGPASVRAYIDELLPDVLEGRIEPGRVFDRAIGLDEVPEGYRTMDERKSIKVMVKP
jgi:threonine dehydrogenase-like Zn-dependent dehydrogenase